MQIVAHGHTNPKPRELCGAGGLKALVGDAEEVRKAVEFGTACGAFVTKVRIIVKVFERFST